MHFKKILIIIFFITSCTTTNTLQNNKILPNTKFSNKGFALIYDFSEDIKLNVSKKIEERSLIIFQRNLKKGTEVKIVNLHNKKSILATVGYNAKYPYFYNSVISKRIAKEIELNIDEPYVEILSLSNENFFIAKKTKTYDEEKQVATKAPVDGISINDISNNSLKKTEKKKKLTNSFNYLIKIADFYFENSANMMKNRILSDTNIKNIKIIKLSKNAYRVTIGPYNNLISLKKAYNDISQLKFENVEIIKL
tara:strand:+ start:1038 stop:1793 length:756 start_codon:yes stop_codon:yes gene_type:complete